MRVKEKMELEGATIETIERPKTTLLFCQSNQNRTINRMKYVNTNLHIKVSRNTLHKLAMVSSYYVPIVFGTRNNLYRSASC